MVFLRFSEQPLTLSWFTHVRVYSRPYSSLFYETCQKQATISVSFGYAELFEVGTCNIGQFICMAWSLMRLMMQAYGPELLDLVIALTQRKPQ